MEKPGTRELLIGCVLEPQLLRRLQENPEAVLTEYDVSDRARDILSSPDERLLELLGEAVVRRDGDSAEHEQSADVGAVGEQSSPAAVLPASRLALRLVPYVQQAANAAPSVVVNYAGHLDPLPDGIELDELPDVPSGLTDGQQLRALAVTVSIQPVVWTDDAGDRQMTFSVGAQLPQDTAVPHSNVTIDDRLSPWRHDTDSASVGEAATRVREASADDRYAQLRELIDVMVSPPESSGEPR